MRTRQFLWDATIMVAWTMLLATLLAVCGCDDERPGPVTCGPGQAMTQGVCR